MLFLATLRERVWSYLSRQWWDRDTRALALKDVAEVLEVGIATADDGVAQFERGDVGARVDFVGGIHGARGGAVCLWVLDLCVCHQRGPTTPVPEQEVTDFYLQEVLWRAVDLLEGLLASIWHGLHFGVWEVAL